MLRRDPAVEARSVDVWHRWFPFWNAYFGVCLVGTLSLVILQTGGGEGAIAVVLLLALAVGYLLLGRRALHGADASPVMLWSYVAIMFACFLPASTLVPASAFALTALTPQLYMALPGRLAGPLTALLMTGVGFRWVTAVDANPLRAALILIILLAVGITMGGLIGWLADQNADRARLIAELDRTRGELVETSLEAGVLAERERLAGDIHDTVAQGLGGISMLLQAAEAETGPNAHITAARAQALENLDEVRSLVAALAPPALQDRTLTAALEDLTAGTSPRAALTITGVVRTLPAETDAIVLRMVQEGLTNINKHAAADTADVDLHYAPAGIRAVIRDDGRGGATTSRPDTYGLRTMQTRIQRAGGQLSLESRPGGGTVISAELPC